MELLLHCIDSGSLRGRWPIVGEGWAAHCAAA